MSCLAVSRTFFNYVIYLADSGLSCCLGALHRILQDFLLQHTGSSRGAWTPELWHTGFGLCGRSSCGA